MEINNQKSASIQTIMAMLITNKRYVLKALENPKKFINQYQVSEKTSDEFITFINNYGSKFISSALLLNKKRFDSVISALTVINKLFSISQLEMIWERYLTTIEIDEEVPKNPLLESIRFCQYVNDFEKIDEIQRNLIEYETIRNQVIIDHSLHNVGYSQLSAEFNTAIPEEAKKIKGFIHPCAQIKEFSCNISELIQALANDSSKEDLKRVYKGSNEKMLFCKNWIKGGILSVKISEVILNAIAILHSSKTLPDFITLLSEKLSINSIDANTLIKMLIQSGIMIVIPVNNLSEKKYV
ncbi:MAG: hypothetical protein Q8L78_05285 [Coxiellaceae bacterium]|nr:hypothetical protein [Coxiellaceae bacterium]